MPFANSIAYRVENLLDDNEYFFGGVRARYQMEFNEGPPPGRSRFKYPSTIRDMEPKLEYRDPIGLERLVGSPEQARYNANKKIFEDEAKVWQASRKDRRKDIQSILNMWDIPRHNLSIGLIVIALATGNIPLATVVGAQLAVTDLPRALDFINARLKEDASRTYINRGSALTNNPLSRGIFSAIVIFSNLFDENGPILTRLKKVGEGLNDSKEPLFTTMKSILDGIDGQINKLNEFLAIDASAPAPAAAKK